jgi:hypothetical protein
MTTEGFQPRLKYLGSKTMHYWGTVSGTAYTKGERIVCDCSRHPPRVHGRKIQNAWLTRPCSLVLKAIRGVILLLDQVIWLGSQAQNNRQGWLQGSASGLSLCLQPSKNHSQPNHISSQPFPTLAYPMSPLTVGYGTGSNMTTIFRSL